ncbi:hypothetical protein NECAME_11808 [Necator americanus]|uniref:Uncharacterized protein n=1 Tax=Necator americanus TaxID=51031 RepID=W2T4U8_NECAM|nr:hypothetical protein NECAME_11808 [Necator americanus]ETN76241.1 hypothetical protein NECAME_11808 [Necator americanus]
MKHHRDVECNGSSYHNVAKPLATLHDQRNQEFGIQDSHGTAESKSSTKSMDANRPLRAEQSDSNVFNNKKVTKENKSLEGPHVEIMKNALKATVLHNRKAAQFFPFLRDFLCL